MFLHPRSQVYVSGVASISPSVLTRGPTRVLNMTCEPSTCSSTLATTPGGSGRHGRPFFHSPGPSFPEGDGYPSMNWVQYTRYGMDDNNPFSSFFFFNEQRGHMSSVQNPCCLMIVWDSTVGEYHNPKSENNRMDHMDHMVTMRSTEQKHAKNRRFQQRWGALGCPFGTKSFGSMPAHFWSNSVPSPFLCTFLTILHLHAILYRRIFCNQPDYTQTNVTAIVCCSHFQ